MNFVRVSTTPSPFASRSKAIRFALGTAEPAFSMTFFIAETFDALRILGAWRRVRFCDEHIAVRQHIQPARMIELRCKRCDFEAWRDDRVSPRWANLSPVRYRPSALSAFRVRAASERGR